MIDYWLGSDAIKIVPSDRPQVKSAEEIKRMTPAEKLDWCRTFDQSKMPPWKDPRVK
jgi:hypothetical protein